MSMKSLMVILVTMLLALSLWAEGACVTASVDFFNERLEIRYDPTMKLDEKSKLINTYDKRLKGFYETMKAGPHEILLNDLLAYREELNLNDWLYCRMVRIVIDSIYADNRETHRALVWWFLLNESGYDVRLCVSELIYVFLFAASEDKLLDVGSFKEDDKRFYNITAKIYNVETTYAIYNKPRFVANPDGRPFSFSLEQMPLLQPDLTTKNITFHYQDEPITLTVELDKVVQDFMVDYPLLEEMDYLNTGLSTTLQTSLLPQLEALMEGKTVVEKLEILAAFTRSGFQYKWDWDVYDEDRPMFAEQIFHHKYSDHEDRCALYYYLVKELLGLPMLAITHYNNNMTLAVALDGSFERSFQYKGRQFIVCDPTHPVSTGEIGRYPNGLTKATATVVGEYGVGD